MALENTTDKNIEKDCIRLFGPLFSIQRMFFTTKDWADLEIFDLPTQFFIKSEMLTPIYSKMSEEFEQIINKVIKDNHLWELTQDKITIEHITQFRRLFWKHPETEAQIKNLSDKYDWCSEIELLNTFFKEMVRLSVYTDEQLSNLREFRIFLARKSITFDGDVSDDLKSDLFSFLDFGRFNTDEHVKKKANETLKEICKMIENKECPDLRFMKTYNDWDNVPMKVVSMVEKLVLLNYCDKPDQRIVEEIRTAVDKMDLDLLKEYLNFTPKWRQKYALLFESRENLAANCRRSWKSFLSTYINIRQIFLPGQMCLYILPSKEDYSEQPFFYIEQMLENVKKRGVELPWFQFNAKQFRVVNKLFKSKIIFLSAQGSSKGKSFSANLVTLDEAWYIDDGNLYEQASNSTSDTKGRMWAVSTINVDTPINWFFYKKVTLDGMEDARVISVDIYNNPFMKDDEKKRKEMQYKDKNKNVWLADWMAIFVGWSDGFDISTFFQIDFVYDVVTFKWVKFNMVREMEKYEKFMLFYDPAKNKDKAGLAMVGKKWNRCDVVMTWYIDIKNYFLQWEVIVDILEYTNKIKNCEFGIDLGKAWEAAFDWFESKKISPYGILSTGGNEFTKKTYRRWNVPASKMETNLHTLISAGVVKWFSWLDRIRNEFETYNLSKERKAGIDHHHDVLSALMNAVFIWYERWVIGFDFKKATQDIEEMPVDAYWRPINAAVAWQFNGNIMKRFLH